MGRTQAGSDEQAGLEEEILETLAEADTTEAVSPRGKPDLDETGVRGQVEAALAAAAEGTMALAETVDTAREGLRQGRRWVSGKIPFVDSESG